jgi:predicted Rossmann fold nucleotide-binding protein DprA/Smf involved in DNA uptake
VTTPRSASSTAALLLVQRLVETPAAPLKASEYWSVLEAVGDPARLLGAEASEIADVLGVDRAFAERVARLLDAATAFAFGVEELEQAGTGLVGSLDDDYPSALLDRLGRAAPPLLHVAGDVRLLQADLLGIVGSRDVGPDGAMVARTAAVHAVEHGFGVVSGGAKGVDRLSMTAALDGGGSVVAVLADALVATLRDPDVRRAIGDGSLCVCTPYKPTAGFTVANAMGRNKLVYALARATLVVAAEPGTGGTWAGAVEALERHVAPVLVWCGAGASAGNALLVERGGVPIDDLARLFPLPSGPGASVPSEARRQLAFDV